MKLSSAEVLALYDAEQRRDVEYSDTRREASSNIVRHVARLGGRGTVLYSDLRGRDVESVAREQIEYFTSIGQDFEWKVFEHDFPADLGNRLAALGFKAEPEETIVYLDLDALPDHLVAASTANVERVDNPGDVDKIAAVMSSVWREDFSDSAASLKAEMQGGASTIEIYVVRLNGELSSIGWIRFHAKGCFASLWGGTTVPRLRNRGLYTALVATRVREAKRRGCRYITVDALPTSRPILDKLGFKSLTRTRGHIWNVDHPKEKPYKPRARIVDEA